MTEPGGRYNEGHLLLTAALRYAKLGFPVFPIGAGTKTPLTEHGFKDATPNVAPIKRWRHEHPDAGIAIPTGAGTFDALDVDPRHGGDESLATLINGSHFPEGPAAETGGGGRHYCFNHVEGISSRIGFRPGLDWKGNGGYIVVAPSLHASGERYRWKKERAPGEIEIPDPPGWLVEALLQRQGPQRTQRTQRTQRKRKGPLLEGERNDQLFRAACAIRREGLGYDEIVVALERINESRCKPPLDHRELCSIANSAASYPIENQNLTDLGNAKRLARLHGRDIRHCHLWKKWFIWDGTRWKVDDTGEVERRAKATVQSMYDEAKACKDKKRRKAIPSWRLRSEARSRISAMIELAASEPGVPILPEKLNANPWLLNVMNGTIDLRTGELRPHGREDYITQRASVAYHSEAECPTSAKSPTRSCSDAMSASKTSIARLDTPQPAQPVSRCCFFSSDTARTASQLF